MSQPTTPTIAEQIAMADQMVLACQDHLRKAVEKADALREQEKREATKTPGQRIAEAVVYPMAAGYIGLAHKSCLGRLRVLRTQHTAEHVPQVIGDLRAIVAAGIDQALSDQATSHAAELAKVRDDVLDEADIYSQSLGYFNAAAAVRSLKSRPTPEPQR